MYSVDGVVLSVCSVEEPHQHKYVGQSGLATPFASDVTVILFVVFYIHNLQQHHLHLLYLR